ncbi:MAG: PQQ-dependent sugar dehydrogenase [Bacteroidetes bacterium]|nr:PQQ-dependent sugar dehydrogenase [Bacteroidota bacterium]
MKHTFTTSSSRTKSPDRAYLGNRNFNFHSLLLFSCIFLLSLSDFRANAQTYPSGFTEVQVATGLSNPTVMTAAPDGRIFIAEQSGTLRIFKNGSLLSQSFVTLSVNSSGERGLLGIAFDPAFATNQYIYLYYTVSSGANNRISRFTANGDVAVAGSEVVLLNLDPLTSATNHNGGTMQFGPDGKLYVGIGENANSANAQNLDTYHGKILRLNTDGTPASGNPYSTGSVQRRSVWSYGVRNPYTLTFQPGTGKLFVNDVGQNTWEEINNATSGGLNFGWPAAEGTSSNSAYANPVYSYAHGSGGGQGCAITGGAFFNPSATNYPATYTGNYFYIDYCSNWIDRLSISGNTATRSNFASNIGGNPVGLITGTDGNLYFLSRSSSSLKKIVYASGTSPVITAQPQSTTVAQGNSASFSVSVSGSSPFTFQWGKNGSSINGATGSTYTIAAASTADGGTYTVVITNSAGTTTSNGASLTVSAVNQFPTATIQTPTPGTTYTAGTSFSFSGSGNDPEDGVLGASAFEWYVIFHHDIHTHPGPTATDGVTSGSFAIPDIGETAANVYYRLYLVVTDLQGAKDTTYTDILPNTSTMTFNTTPQGLEITLDGQPFVTPFTVTGVEGVLRTIGTSSPQVLNSVNYVFSNWSQGGAQTQAITTPVNNTTYTALFTTNLRTPENPSGTVNGLNFAYYHGTWSTLPAFAALTPVSTGIVTNLDLSPRTQNDNFGFSFNGFIQIPADGIYTFYTSSDDGSKMYIGSTLVVSNDGLHANTEASGQIGLLAGKHAITVDYFERSGQEILTLNYEGPGIVKKPVPSASLFIQQQASMQNPVADSYVRGGSYSNTNYGTLPQLYSRKGTNNGSFETYLRFDISNFPSIVTSASIRLFGRVNNTNVVSIPVDIYYVSDNAWLETSINNSNKPAAIGGPLATVTITGTIGQYYEWDITQQVNTLKASGATAISVLVSEPIATNGNRFVFRSRESSSNKPELTINASIARPPFAELEEAQFTLRNAEPFEFKIYPQPANDLITLELPESFMNATLNIISMNGQNVYSAKLNGNTIQTIPLNQLEMGLYIISIHNGEEMIKKRMLIQK